MTSKDWSGNINSVWKTIGASSHTENVSGTGTGKNHGYFSGKLRRSVGNRGGDYED